MTLQKCVECGHEISSMAAACSACGCPGGGASAASTRLAECDYCHQMIDAELPECPKCGVQVFKSHRGGPSAHPSKPKGLNAPLGKGKVLAFGCGGILLILAVASAIGNGLDPVKRPAPSSTSQPATIPIPPATASSPTVTYSNEQLASARSVMTLVRQDCSIYPEGPHLVVEMKNYIEDKNKLLGYCRAIANADAVLERKSRPIYFHDPNGKMVASAHPGTGVRLKE